MKIKAKKENNTSNLKSPEIIFENDQLIVINKPAGWIVNDAETTGAQPTVQEWLRQNFQFPIFNLHECRNGIVHRLDKPTSGCLIVAKNKESFENLQAQFQDRTVKKRYIALGHGKSKLENGLIDAPVGRLPWRRDRFGVLVAGRSAKTEYKVLGSYSMQGQDYTLFELFPRTGRTHQIRIHLKYIGNPIVADTFYAGRKTSRNDLKWCPRLFLHASEIEFKNPTESLTIRAKAPLPSDLQSALDKCSI